nr:hypothetical protein [Tanacetum cinerariifolium]
MVVHQGEGSGTPTEPHHTPFPEVESSHPTTSSIPLPSIPTALISTVTQPDPTPIRQYSRRARIAQSYALLTVADEPASPMRDVSKGEAYLTDSGFIADQDRVTIAKSSTLPHDSAPRAILLACSIPIGWAYAFHQDKASLVRIPVANVTLSSSAHLLRENNDSSGRTVTLTTDDMQKKQNDVKARTTLLLSLLDEHQWRLQVIVSQLQFMDVEIEKDDLNQKFLTSLAPEWLMHTIVWRNRNHLDSMSLDDLYNHLKVYEAEVQKKSNSNSQDMAFISSSKNSSNEDGNTVCVTTASTTFPTGSVNVPTISQDTASAYIASQFNGSQSFDKSKVECFNCHKMGHFVRECRAPKSHERGRKESYRQGSKAEEKSSKALMAIDGVGWDWSYMENEEDHALVADGEALTEFALM